MTPVNVKGFDMNPSRGEVETALKEYNREIIAMNIISVGAFPLAASSAYVKSFDKVTRCVVGASLKEHLCELRDVLD